MASSRSRTPPARRFVKFQLDDAPVKKYDSVDSIMDRIDNELHTLKPAQMSERQTVRSRPRSLSSHGFSRSRSGGGARVPEAVTSRDVRDGLYTDLRQSRYSLARPHSIRNTTATGVAYSSGGMYSSSPALLTLSEQNINNPRSTSYQHHHTAEDLRSRSQVEDEESLDTPRTEDFEECFNSTLVKQAPAQPVSSFSPVRSDSDSALVQRRLRERGFAVDAVLTLPQPVGTSVASMTSQAAPGERNTTPTPTPYNRNPLGNISPDSDFDGDITREIREESNRIQKELELERKANQLRHSTPTKSSSSSHSSTPCNSTTGTVIHQVEEPEQNKSRDTELIQQLNQDKLKLLEEIGDIRKTLKLLQQDVVVTEKQAKENRNKAEEARTEMMLSEFKKNAALQEFTELSNELQKGRKLQAVLHKDAEKIAERSSSAGLTTEELSDLLSERNQLRFLLDGRNGSLQMEKDELEHQLNSTKQQLFSEQKKHRQELDTLEERLETQKVQLNEALADKETRSLEMDSIRSKVDKLERQLRDAEKFNLQALIERDKELEVLKESSQRDSMELRVQLSNELSNARKLLKLSEEKCSKLQQEIQNRERSIQELREECMLLQSRTVDEQEASDQLIRELQKQLESLEIQKSHEVEAVKQQMEIEQIGVIDSTKSELERQHEEVIYTLKEDYNIQLTQQQQALNGKDEEICLLRSRLSQQEEASYKLAERLKADTQIQLEQALQNERYVWEKEKKYVEGTQLKRYKEEAEKQHQQLADELDAEQRRCRQLDEQYKAVKKELEDQRRQNQKLYQDKISAVNQSRQSAQEEVNIQLERIRQRMEEDTEKLLDKMKEEMALKEEEVRCLRNECQALQQNEADLFITLEKLEKLLVNEINDECRKTAHLLGVTPRKTQINGLRNSMSPNRSEGCHKKTRSIAASAFANLRGCNEELRNSVKELKEDVETLKSALHKVKKSKDAELDQLRKQLNRDKTHDMEDLKHRLTQIVSTQRSVLDMLEISPASLLEPDAHSTDIESDSVSDATSYEHKDQLNHICMLVSDQNAHSRLLRARERELQSIHKHMSTWKDQTATKMADKFGDELLNQLKLYMSRLEQKVVEKSIRNTFGDSSIKTPSRSYDHHLDELEVDDLGASPKLRQSVQNRLRQLRAGSPSRKNLTTSTPDLSNLAEGASSALEQRVKLAELKAHLAEERASRNQVLLNHKLQEVNQLQNALNSQTKEIISLERSFEELKNSAYTPPESSTTTEHS